MITITKKDLVALGYGPSFSADIIKKAKEQLIEQGHTYYKSKKLDRVPTNVVEEILGISISNQSQQNRDKSVSLHK
ncbi:DUF3173 family protein [Enterococcus casseliflavus]|uniref:DUF3173 family protein n=1 Tax=Enterococcus casseliflavus TaxID=37734 RepID=UPI00232AC483|nr:DUF3173 family protein [Enterococcus casseliflavus]MDB1688221.1 DUF3173 family protein [Enterococcus casseliflavus]